jgi:hypothetical protein
MEIALWLETRKIDSMKIALWLETRKIDGALTETQTVGVMETALCLENQNTGSMETALYLETKAMETAVAWNPNCRRHGDGALAGNLKNRRRFG